MQHNFRSGCKLSLTRKDRDRLILVLIKQGEAGVKTNNGNSLCKDKARQDVPLYVLH